MPAATDCTDHPYPSQTKFPCTSAARHLGACAPRPPPMLGIAEAAVGVLPADGMRWPADNYGCRFECPASWNPAGTADSGSPNARNNRAGRTAAHRSGSGHTLIGRGYGLSREHSQPCVNYLFAAALWKLLLLVAPQGGHRRQSVLCPCGLPL